MNWFKKIFLDESRELRSLRLSIKRNSAEFWKLQCENASLEFDIRRLKEKVEKLLRDENKRTKKEKK